MRVLLDTREKHFFQNSYIGDLVESLPEVEFSGFSWRRLLFGRYDLFHVHWPEWLVKHGRQQLEVPMKLLLAAGLLRQRLTRTPIVRTMHNLQAHQKVNRTAELLLTALEKQTAARIWLTEPAAASRHSRLDVTIAHPDYGPWRDRLRLPDVLAPSKRRGFCFGSLTPYRQFEQVARAAKESTSGHLTIAGSPTDAQYADALEKIASTAPEQVTVIQERLDDKALALLILRSDVVFVPYKDLYNSGVIFLALTLQRPVALAAGEQAQRLEDEYGRGWIRQWSGTLDAEQFIQILDAPRPESKAHSMKREWSTVSAQHRTLYDRIAQACSPIPAGRS